MQFQYITILNPHKHPHSLIYLFVHSLNQHIFPCALTLSKHQEYRNDVQNATQNRDSSMTDRLAQVRKLIQEIIASCSKCYKANKLKKQISICISFPRATKTNDHQLGN